MCCVLRVVQTGKALQDQQWLFENLMVQVEERRSAVENSAKQIEDRLVCAHIHVISDELGAFISLFLQTSRSEDCSQEGRKPD